MGRADQLRDDVIALHKKGMSRDQIAHELGCERQFVTEVAQEEGLVFKTRSGQHKRLEEAADQRARIMKKMNDAAEKMLGLLDQPVVAFNFGGRDNTYAEHELPEPTIQDKLRLMQAAKVGVDAGLALAAHDAGSARVSINLIMATAEKLGLDTSDGE